jgi:ABC-type dipeptide/oligopeptide/nickel transport system permease component
VTGAFIIEIVFNIKGLSEIVTRGLQGTPDAALALGFAIFSVLLVMPLMVVFDILKSAIDPRMRDEELDA